MNLPKKNGRLTSMFQDFFNPPSLFNRNFPDINMDLSPSLLGINLPTANISEGSKEYKLELAAPGLQHKDFNIEIENNMLKISSEKEEEKNEETEGYSRKEYSFNSFTRTFSLPENIKEDGIQATYENGILKIIIPKQVETHSKPIQKIKVT